MTDGGNKNERPAPREKRGPFLDSLGPYGEGHTTDPVPKLMSEFSDPEFTDERTAIGVHLDEDRAAEAIDGANHIMAADEVRIANAAIVAEAERVIDANALHIGAMEFVARHRTGCRCDGPRARRWPTDW
jgi:hypothetical protein